MTLGESPAPTGQPVVQNDVGALARDVLARKSPNSALIVGIDGFTGAGKTVFSKMLGALIGGATFHTDCYVTKQVDDGATSYLDCVSGGLSKLRDEICAVKDVVSAIIIEGICLVDTANALGIHLDVAIYVRHESAQHRGDDLRWYDGDDLIRYGSGDLPFPPPPHGWAVGYHLKQRPHKTADYVFQRGRYEFD